MTRNDPLAEWTLSDFQYRRQFVLGPRQLRVGNGWAVHTLDPRLVLSCDPMLVVTQAIQGEHELWVLGHMLDPMAPERGNQEVANAILAQLASFAEFEQAMETMAGRWIALVRIGAAWRLYPDAAGLKSVFFGRAGPDREFWICSQPGLLSDALGLRPEEARAHSFQSGNRGNSWPGEVTPFASIRQLLPNHYLDLRTGESARFWWGQGIRSYEMSEAASDIADLLHGVMASAAGRGTLALPVTGGYDSRALLACAGGLRHSTRFFCIVDPMTPRSDVALARRVGSAAGVRVELVRTRPASDAFWQSYRLNTAGMFWDPGSLKLYTFCSLCLGRIALTGGVGEMGRCFYYTDGHHPHEVDARELALRAGFGNNEVAIQSFDAWMRDVPGETPVPLLDLFYWEHRLGNWLAMSGNIFDAAIDVLPPFNCRKILAITLGVPVPYRRYPHALFRRICELKAPSTAKVPFNDHWSARIEAAVESVLHWRLRRAMTSVRLRMTGLSHPEDC